MSPSSVPDRPVFPPRSMPHPKVFRSSCSTRALRRAGWGKRAHRKLSGIPDRHIRPGADGRAFVQAQKFGAEMVIPCEVKRLDCRGEAVHGSISRRAARAARPWCASRRALSPAQHRRSRGVRRSRRVVLGLADRGAPVREEEIVLVGGGNSAGQAAVFLAGFAAKILDAGARRGARRDHVALSDRPDRRNAQHRGADAHGDRRPERQPAITAGAGALAPIGRRKGDRETDPQRVSVHRRRPRDGVACRLRHLPRSVGFRAHRRKRAQGSGVSTPGESAASCRSKPAFREFSPSAISRAGSVKRVGRGNR